MADDLLDPGYDIEVIRRAPDSPLEMASTNLTAQPERDLAPRRRKPEQSPLAEARAYKPSLRERHADAVQQYLKDKGLDNYAAARIAQTVIGGPQSRLPLGLGLSDIAMVAPYSAEEAGYKMGEAKEAASEGEYLDALMAAGVGALPMLPFAKPAAGLAKSAVKALRPAKAATDIPKIKEVGYETTQEGPFYRVKPKLAQEAGSKDRGIREEVRSPDIAAGSVGSNVSQPISDEAVGALIKDPSNFVQKAANDYSQTATGRGYQLPQMPESSLAKQSAIGRTFGLAAEGGDDYKNAVFKAYGQAMPEVVEASGAKNYDQLMEAAYRQLAKETEDQFRTLPVNMSYHRAGEGNYQSSGEMLRDIYGNRHLYVYQGGDPHDFLNAVDPRTGLNTNEMFRAVHDFYGHAVHGNPFGPKGEEIAYGAHSQMFSPLARMAMASETRGQNSFVNYTPINAELKQRINRLNEARYEASRRGDRADVADIDNLIKEAWGGFQFAPQKSVLLPPEFLETSYTGGMPKYIQPLIKPEAGTTTSEMLTHFSHAPDIEVVDPSRYGSGIQGREAARLLGTQNPVMERSYFYTGEPSSVRPEPGLGPFRYGARGEGLYNVEADPLAFRVLAAEANRTPFTAIANKGLTDPTQAFTDVERLAKEYGFEGLLNPQQRTAIKFGPTPVKRYAEGGAVHMSDGGDPERAAFGVYPSSGKRREELNVSRNVNAPLQLARGWLAGTLGIPGDVETLGRLLANFSFGPGGVKVPTESVLPTSEYFQEVIPGRDTSPAGELFSGAGQLTGGLGAVKGAKAAGRAAKAAGEALAPKAGQMAEGYLQKAGLMPGVIKPKGGNWLTGDVERQTRPLKPSPETPPELLRELGLDEDAALNQWVDQKLNKYIKNEMGTPEDPVRKLAEQNILHFEPQQVFGDAPSTLMRKRAGAGMPTPLFGQSEMARRWESLADRAIDPFPAGSYKYGALDESFLASNPWLEKVPDEAMVYKAKGLRRDMGFDHLIDELRNATRADSDLPARLRWKPEDLSKVTMEQAVKRVHDINEWRAAQKAEANAAKAQNPATFLHKEYEIVPGTAEPNEKGLKWVELKTPEFTSPEELSTEAQSKYQQYMSAGADHETSMRRAIKHDESLSKALKYEGETMGHCVGGYCPDVESGRSRIFSLRDKKGEPHVTVEVKPVDDSTLQRQIDWKQYSALQDKSQSEADKWLAQQRQSMPPEIVQIKGKGNKAPKDEYLPFVQDFVKGGQWNRVGDYRNTGLRERAEMFDALDLNKLKAAGHDVPEHLTPDESKKYSDLLYTIDTGKNPETGLPTQNYAEGGAVAMETVPDMSDGGRTILADEIHGKSGGAVEKMTETLTRGGMDKDKATLHAIKLAQAREQEPIKVKKKAIPEGAEEFRKAIEQKFQAGGLAKFLTGGAKAASAEKKVIPLVFERAAPKTKAEIEAIAERMAPQALGEFVRKPGKTESVAGKTRKQFEREKEMQVDIAKTGESNLQPLNIEKQKGKVQLGIFGDPSIGGAELRGIDDIKYDIPVGLHGGPLYHTDPLSGGHLWASGDVPSNKIQRAVNRVSEAYGGVPVLGQYQKMTPEANYYAMHYLDALLSHIQPEKLPVDKREMLTKMIREGKVAEFGKHPYFQGFEDPIDVLLQAQINPNLRKSISATLTMPTTSKELGTRSGQDVMSAITERELGNLEPGAGGFVVGELQPGAKVKSFESRHPTYESDIPGEAIGRMKYPMPLDLSYPDVINYIEQNPAKIGLMNRIQGITARQIIDQQLVDEIKMYEEAMKKLTGLKKGGLAQATRK